MRFWYSWLLVSICCMYMLVSASGELTQEERVHKEKLIKKMIEEERADERMVEALKEDVKKMERTQKDCEEDIKNSFMTYMNIHRENQKVEKNTIKCEEVMKSTSLHVDRIEKSTAEEGERLREELIGLRRDAHVCREEEEAAAMSADTSLSQCSCSDCEENITKLENSHIHYTKQMEICVDEKLMHKTHKYFMKKEMAKLKYDLSQINEELPAKLLKDQNDRKLITRYSRDLDKLSREHRKLLEEHQYLVEDTDEVRQDIQGCEQAKQSTTMAESDSKEAVQHQEEKLTSIQKAILRLEDEIEDVNNGAETYRNYVIACLVLICSGGATEVYYLAGGATFSDRAYSWLSAKIRQMWQKFKSKKIAGKRASKQAAH